MAHIGEIVQQSDLAAAKSWSEKPVSQQGYVAPTVYLLAGKKLSGYNYYNSLTDVYKKYAFLTNQPGSKDVNPAGRLTFKTDGSAQTAGINCDFATVVKGTAVLSTYAVVRDTIGNAVKSGRPIYFIAKFYTTAGKGPYYALFTTEYFSIAATVVSDVDKNKLAALDEFHREVQLVKAKYNAYAYLLSEMSSRKLTDQQQQIFNAALLEYNSLGNRIRSIKGVNITEGKNGQIGLPIPLLIWIVVAVIASLAIAGWTIKQIIEEKEKTKQLNDNYDAQKWVLQNQQAIVQGYKEGKWTKEEADMLLKGTGIVLESLTKTQDKLSTPGSSMFGDIASVAKWLVVGVVVYKGSELIGNSKSAK